ncbi:uncharacterized protein F5891DRAFT_964511, partial [Suillus fuscotomentosus]
FYQAIHALDRRGHLLRVYTQNIDAMEKTAGMLSYGVPDTDRLGHPDCPRCVPLLGRLDQMTCTLCHTVVSSSAFLDELAQDGFPVCVRCTSHTTSRHRGIWRPNVVVSDQKQPTLELVLSEDEKLVDVLLAVGVWQDTHDNLSGFIAQLSQAVQSRARDRKLTSILINSEAPAPERPEMLGLFQVCLELDLQNFFASIVEVAYQEAVVDSNSNTMLISRYANEDEDCPERELFLSLPPWHFPSP